MCKGKFVCAALLLVSVGLAAAENETPALIWSGYYKNLFLQSETVTGTVQPYVLDLNRLRLKLQATLTAAVSLEVQYDNEILFGNYLRTAQFQLQKQVRPLQYWQSESNYLTRETLEGRQRWYRASIAVTHGDTDLKLGRQRIAWGTGRFWSPLDIINPIAPTQLERDERPGADAVLLERKFGPLARLSLVVAPLRAPGHASTALQYHDNYKAADYSIVFGELQQDRMLGIDIATQLGRAGLRGELTYTRPKLGPGYRRSLIGIDYAFANSLTLTAEYYYNGRGAADAAAYDGLFGGRILSLARNYAGFYAGYEITALLKWNNYAIVNLDDRSRYLSTDIVYSLRENLDWRLGLQSSGGRGGSEYGKLPPAYHTQLQWYF
ncbi:MAG: hypothetical protein HYZ65_07220 [Burkholderiales bacterium]|nr:hypothetical protein [Burkholderiales bacterium]